MSNRAGGPNRKPRRGGQRGFWLGVWGLWSLPPSQSSNNDPDTSFQSILRERNRAKRRVALQTSGLFR